MTSLLSSGILLDEIFLNKCYQKSSRHEVNPESLTFLGINETSQLMNRSFQKSLINNFEGNLHALEFFAHDHKEDNYLCHTITFSLIQMYGREGLGTLESANSMFLHQNHCHFPTYPTPFPYNWISFQLQRI